MNQNIVVFGARRTGTSLFIELLSRTKSNGYTVDIDKYYLTESEYKDLQPYYNEGVFRDGINVNNSINYYTLNKKIIKMFKGLFQTDITYFSSFKNIIVTYRNWLKQNNSVKNLMRINAKAMVINKGFLDKKYSREEFIEDCLFDDGIEYGYFYSYFVVDIYKRKYGDKVILIEFDELIQDPKKIDKFLNKFGLSISDSLDLINKNQTKFGKQYTREGLVEFHEGFFDFLDELYQNLTKGDITGEFVKKTIYWIEKITNNLLEREIKIYKKYNIILSNKLEDLVKKGKVSREI